ncbi:ubiquitin-conjugating enzyme/RWD-like protein [Peziza echinospora]|nr:ubiquitin-conjugating enzyme/RWD-like protein [Peziza echinospora]
MSSQRRIAKELADMAHDPSSGMQASMVDQSSMMHLVGMFKGPPDTPYEGGEFQVDIQLPDNYPFSPPRMKFKTKVWHPNVSSQTGAICLDTLSAKWTPVLTIKTALLSLQSLLSTPEPNDPQDAEVANMMINNPSEFKRKARDWAIRHAGAPSAPVTSATSSNGQAGVGSKQISPEEKMRQERERDLQGYDGHVVDRFTAMGFSVRQVVAALRSTGIRPDVKRLNEENAQMVAVHLLES